MKSNDQLLNSKSKLQFISNLLKMYVPQSSSYLDIGCNDGKITRYVAEAVGAKCCYGIDLDAVALQKASQNDTKTWQLNISEYSLPFECDSLDLITAFDIIEHLGNPDNMLSEVNRVLKQNGFFLLSTPNVASWFNRLLLLFGKPPLGIDLSTEWRYRYFFGVEGVISGHIRLYTPMSLTKLMEYHGFKVITVKSFPQLWIKTKPVGLMRAVLFLDLCFSRHKGLSSNFLVLVGKSALG